MKQRTSLRKDALCPFYRIYSLVELDHQEEQDRFGKAGLEHVFAFGIVSGCLFATLCDFPTDKAVSMI